MAIPTRPRGIKFPISECGIPFQVFYGISGNSHRFWGIANARRVISYEPEDNSGVKFADVVGEVMAGAKDE